MASTLLTLNTDALSRAADAILARGDAPSKNAILNALAAAIAGPGHDWGYLKNAPSGHVSQAGITLQLDVAPTPPKPHSAWVVQCDERDDWARAPQLFASQQAALDHIAEDRKWWSHPDHAFDTVMHELRTSGEYTFTSDDDDSDDDASPYQIWLQEVTIEPGTEAQAIEPASDVTEPSDTHILIESPVAYKEQGMSWDEAIFASLADAEKYASENNLDVDLPDWRKTLHRADACKITATFSAEVWINDYATPVDPEGETEWIIDADEMEADRADLDYLQTSRHAPEWVKEWIGPFEVTLDIAPAADA